MQVSDSGRALRSPSLELGTINHTLSSIMARPPRRISPASHVPRALESLHCIHLGPGTIQAGSDVQLVSGPGRFKSKLGATRARPRGVGKVAVWVVLVCRGTVQQKKTAGWLNVT